MGSGMNDLTGKTFGRLTVIKQAPARGVNRGVQWWCRCACGTFGAVRADCLTGGGTASCGCLKLESVAAQGRANATHGKTKTREYAAWRGMWTRCTNERRPDFALYGGRGIIVCKRWAAFEAFLSDMGLRPAGGSLERIDTNGNYEPSNVRWATAKEQARNRRTNRVLEIDGRRSSLAEWADRSGVSQDVIGARLRIGWTGARLISPVRPQKKRTRARA
jgi:hypothetical protein